MAGRRSVRAIVLGLTFGVGVAGVGCAKKGGPAKPPEDAVARVGDRFITAGQMQRHIDRLPPVLRQQYASAQARRPLLDALVRQETLVQAARARGLDDDPEYQEVVEQQLIALLLRRSLEGQDEAKTVRDQEIEGYYREHLAQFSAPDQVRLAQIVVADRALGERIHRQVKALRRDDAKGFAALVAKHSVDAPSREQGGDTGFLSRDSGAFSPTVRAAGFLLSEPGDVADLVETEYGFHILRLTERRAFAARPLAEVKEEIRQRLLTERRSKRTDALIAETQAKAKVEIFEARLGSTAASAPATTVKRDGK